MANGDNEVKMMMSVVPGAMTGFAALNAGMSSILNVFNSFTRSFDAQFGLMDAAITTTSFVVTQLGVDAMHAFGEFEQGMKIVQMVSGQTAQDMEFLKQKANDFSVQYRMDIDQITEGLQTLGRAGLNSASEQTEVLQAGLNTAKLEGRDLNAILQELIQNTSLLGGDLKSSEFGESSQYVNDLLVATSMTAPITTHDVSETLKYSGGIAAAAGANIETEQGKAILEDYMGAIAAFAQKGVTGSIAGTALRAFLNKPATQDSSVTDALASIKLKPEYLWEDGEETMKPISEQIGLIQKQMDKLDVSKMDRLQIWSKIVGGKMGQQMMKLDSESIKEVTKDIQAADSASNLAAGSMKTFEANVKQVSEQGQVLQRNVGENLVFFANPILELINKITEFLGQDGMAWPLTAGVLTAVSILVKRIVQVFNVAKTELGSLLSMGKEALALHVGKHGYAKWEEEEAIRQQQAQQQTTTSSSKTITATTLKNFDKQYSNLSAVNSALSVSAMKTAEVSDQNIAIAGRLSSLTKQIPIAGATVSEGALWGMAIKQGALTDSELSKLQSGHAAGLSGRALADSLGKGYINTIVPRLEALSMALKELGITVVSETEKINAANLAYKKGISGSYNAAEEAKSAQNWQLGIANQIQKQQQLVSSAQAHATALVGEESAEERAIVMTEKMANTIVLEFNAMWEGIQASIKNGTLIPGQPRTSNVNPLYYSAPGMWGGNLSRSLLYGENIDVNTTPGNVAMLYKHLYPSNGAGASQFFGNIPSNISYLQSSALFKEFESSGLAKIWGYGLDDHRMADLLARQRIPGYWGFSDKVREGHIRNIMAYPDIGRQNYTPLPAGTIYGPASPQGEANRPVPIIGGAGAGSVQSLISKYLGPETANLSKGFAAAAEKAKQTELSRVQIGEDILALERQRLAIEEEILVATRTRAESLGVSASGMQGKGISATRGKEIQDESRAQWEKNQAMLYARQNIDKDFMRNAQGASKYIEEQDAYEKEFNKQKNILKEADKNATLRGMGLLRGSRSSQVITDDQIPKEDYRVLRLDNKSANILEKTFPNATTKFTSNLERANQLYSGSIYRGSKSDIPAYNELAARAAMGFPISYDRNQMTTMERLRTMNLSGLNPYTMYMNSGFHQNFQDRLNRNRMGSFFSFGRENILNEAGAVVGVRSATKGLKGFGNKLLNATDMVGGPFMIAMMAATTAIQMWQKAFQDYCQELQDAKKQLQEAYSERSSAEDQLEQTFRENNPDAEPEEIEMMVLDTYGQLYDDRKNHPEEWMKQTSQYLKDSAKYKEYEYDQEKDDGSYKEKEKEEDTYEEALRKNTAALYSATAEIDIAMSKLTSKMNDTMWGIDGWTGEITDALGYVQDHFWNPEGTTYTEAGDFLLTATQQDENYQGSKEMAGLLLEDFHDAKGNWKQGLKTLYGEDANFLTNVMNMYGRNFLKGNDNFGIQGMAHFANRLTPGGRNRIQASMMNDKKTWQSLAKEIFKYESKNKKRVGTQETSNKRMERLIQKLQIDTHLNRMQVIQAAYFQELQDMYQVMEQVFTPLLADQAQTLAQNLLGTQNIDASSSSTKSSTYGTQSIASVISANVALIAKSKAAEAVYNEALSLGPDNKGPDAENKNHLYQLAKDSQDANDFYKKAMDESYGQGVFSSAGKILGAEFAGAFGGAAHGKAIGQQIDNALGIHVGQNEYAGKEIATVYRALAQISINPNLPLDKALELSRDVVSKDHRGIHDIMTDIGKMYSNPKIIDQIEAAYGASDIGEPEGSGGGSGGGSGSGDKDKDQGTKKERVDLVLCNKKEIPKLNVNLFKKPPTFTVLNKNFKLRDVKINTEDKPKAIMASIKNAFIDVQKRSDPKIIQDEEAEYDPVGATDGNALPSGSSRPKTNNNS